MKRCLFPASLVLFLTVLSNACGTAPPSESLSDDIRLVTLNVHYLVPERDRTGWEERKHALTAALLELQADLVLFQEMETFTGGHIPEKNLQLDWVMETVDGYGVGAVGDPASFPVTQPILYRADRFRLLDQGFFFFSETPDEIYSEPWSGRWPAFTTWVLLEDLSTGTPVHVYNIHLDAFSRTNRIRGAGLIRDRIRTRDHRDSAVLLAGDFNGLKSSVMVRRMAEAGLARAPADGASFHFGRGVHLYGAIDHVFHNDRLRVVRAEVIRKKWRDEWVSDHHPVSVDLRSATIPQTE